MQPPTFRPGQTQARVQPASAVGDLVRHGLTDDVLQKAKQCGLKENDLVEMFNQFGPSSVLVANHIFGKITGPASE